MKVGGKPAFFLGRVKGVFSMNVDMIKKNVLKVALEVAAQETCEVVDLELTGVPGRYMVRVYIDREGGVTISDCSSFSRALGAMLDVEDPVPTAYFLEVSSPGIERVLRTQNHFQRVVGKEVKIKLLSPREGRKNLRGVIEDAGKGGVSLVVGEEKIVVEYENIKRANLKEGS